MRKEYTEKQVFLRKSVAFSGRIVKLAEFLKSERKEYTISGQIVDSGTSIGANGSEAFHGVSKADFEYKLATSQKGAKETKYWLDVLFGSALIDEDYYVSLYNDCDELHKIVTSSILTSKAKGK